MGRRVYICSSFKNSELNSQICKFLEENGFSVFLPLRDTPQNDSHTAIFQRNKFGIDSSEVIIAVPQNGGRDFGFEIGYAYGRGKKIVCFTKDDSYKDDPMLAGAFSHISKSLNELVELIH